MTRPPLPVDTQDKIADLYGQGKTVTDVANICGLPRHTVDKIIARKGIRRKPDSKLLTFNQVWERLPISRGALIRILSTVLPPTKRNNISGAHYYDPDIVRKVRDSEGYRRVISRRIHKKYLRTHPEAYEADKDIMQCSTCRFLSPVFSPDIPDYECTNCRCPFDKIKNLAKRKSCGCCLWETKLGEEERIK